jgi:hypothetical protein
LSNETVLGILNVDGLPYIAKNVFIGETEGDSDGNVF